MNIVACNGLNFVEAAPVSIAGCASVEQVRKSVTPPYVTRSLLPNCHSGLRAGIPLPFPKGLFVSWAFFLRF